MINIGVSSCVLGDSVRYDGGHKRSQFITKIVSSVFNLVPVCPEVGMGMPVPRPTIHIRDFSKDNGIDLRLVDSRDASIDHTSKLNGYFDTVIPKVDRMDGYIVAAKSPSCGMERIKVYNEEGEMLHRKGSGMYTERLKKQFPYLPIEEDGRLNDQGLRESFFSRVMAHNQFREMVLQNPVISSLVEFHSQYKFLVLAYKPDIYRQMGRVVANAKQGDLNTTLSEYQSLMMTALSRAATRKRHTNVLMHIQGFFKKQLSKEDKQELSLQIEFYRLGLVPLLAPLTLMKHHLKRFPNEYIERQSYLQPFPIELGILG